MTITIELEQEVKGIKKTYTNLQELNLNTRFLSFKKQKRFNTNEIIKKYNLDNLGDNSLDITNEIDKIAYNY